MWHHFTSIGASQTFFRLIPGKYSEVTERQSSCRVWALRRVGVRPIIVRANPATARNAILFRSFSICLAPLCNSLLQEISIFGCRRNAGFKRTRAQPSLPKAKYKKESCKKCSAVGQSCALDSSSHPDMQTTAAWHTRLDLVPLFGEQLRISGRRSDVGLHFARLGVQTWCNSGIILVPPIKQSRT